MAIKRFRHKGLKAFFETGSTRGINSEHADTIADILDFLEASHHPADMKAIFRSRFSEKKGSGEGVYSIEVNGNWRITYELSDEGAIVVDYRDYHGKQIKKRSK
ncbi:MAG: type II toxin-antitoxin system RelE/ParE family toxin [Porticoccaceae bacterium]